jgi:hypothetical protein
VGKLWHNLRISRGRTFKTRASEEKTRRSEEGEVLVNFKPGGDYRWVKKQIRVVID